MRYFLLASVLLASPAHAQVITGTATAVDGDTLNMTAYTVRLHGIDAPEAEQTCKRDGEPWTCGKEAAALLTKLIAGKDIACEQQDTDAHGRVVASCRAGRLDLSQMMISAGLAVALPEFTSAYVAGEERARQHNIGIWGTEFQRPAEYRAERPEQTRPLHKQQAEATIQRAPAASATYYRNCNEVRAAGMAPLRRGQPGYRPEMDGDNDGVACEPYRQRR